MADNLPTDVLVGWFGVLHRVKQERYTESQAHTCTHSFTLYIVAHHTLWKKSSFLERVAKCSALPSYFPHKLPHTHAHRVSVTLPSMTHLCHPSSWNAPLNILTDVSELLGLESRSKPIGLPAAGDPTPHCSPHLVSTGPLVRTPRARPFLRVSVYWGES